MGQIKDLKEALESSPGNVPLRRLLAEALENEGQLEPAEEEYKKALKYDPADPRSQLGLAKICHKQGKNSIAIVILEQLLKSPIAPDEAAALYAQLCRHSGEAPEPGLLESRVVQDDAGEPTDPEYEELDESEFVVDGMQRQASEDWAPEDVPAEFEKPKINFSHVGGMTSVKEEISLKIILPLTNKDLYKAYGKAIGGGILLYGPPGCGKTHLARATAGQINAGFIAIGLHDVLDMWIGQSEQKLHAIFEHARRNTPCVLFFDEVDALAASRTDMRASAGRHLINQFLSELDGIGATNEGVLVLAATNAPWHLDSAFRRPGRFDRIILVPPPDADARAEILRILLAGKPCNGMDAGKVAARAEEFSGADLKAIVDLAIEDKLRHALKTGKQESLTTSDMISALKKVKPSTKEWFATARNYALYSNEAGIYDDILKYLKMK
ncbi:MAG: AAA family ATPase [bacterium]